MATYGSMVGRKNHRRHPGIKGSRPDRASLRREEAKVRQDKYNALSPSEKLSHVKNTTEPWTNPAKKIGKSEKEIAKILLREKAKGAST